MHSPIAFCGYHGIFEARHIGIAGSNFTILDCKIDCPTCGRMSEIIPGRYDATDTRLNILVDPSISQEALLAIQQIVIRLQRNEITPEEAKKEVEKISPKAGKLLDVPNWSDQAKATLYASIVGATALVYAAKNNSNSDPIQSGSREPVIERVIENAKNSTALGTVPIPIPRPK